VARKRGKAAPKAPVLPPEAVHVWNAFVQLSSARTSNGFGPDPVTFTEVAAYVDLTGDVLDPWEIEAIREMDHAFLVSAAESKPRK
jgi:hypothetical protein